MGSAVIVQDQFDRLVAHSERWLTEVEYDTLLADWRSMLRGLPDFAIAEAGDELMMLGKMPTLNDFLSIVQRIARDEAAGSAAWRPPTMPETDPQPDDYAHRIIGLVRDYLKKPDFLLLPEPVESAPWRCECGEMRGWVEVVVVPLSVRPCERCRPEQYARWSEDATR